MAQTGVGIMGFGKMPADCAQILVNNNVRVDFLLETEESPFSSLGVICSRSNIDFRKTTRAEAAAFLDRLNDRTVILSINNNFIFPRHIVEREDLRIVNFHNALLPSYRGHGQSIPQWVVYQGETRHGVTWHLVKGRIDAGPILCCETFDVLENDTALTVMIRSIRHGIALFERHWKQFLDFEYAGTPQEENTRRIYKSPGQDRLYRKKNIPNNGYLDRSWDFDQCLRFLRSMDYSRVRLIAPPRIALENATYSIRTYRVEKNGAGPAAGEQEGGKPERTYRLHYDRGVVTLCLEET